MSIRTTFRAGAIAALALGAAASLAPASARETMRHKHHRMHMTSRQTVYRPLTVAGQPMPGEIVAAPSPFSGPVPFISGPTAIAGTIVGLPFRALGTVFPAQGNFSSNPLVVIGAPLHYVGQLAQLPFYGIGRAFGGNPAFPN